MQVDTECSPFAASSERRSPSALPLNPAGRLTREVAVLADEAVVLLLFLLAASGEARFQPPALLRTKVTEGNTGSKAGQGFFGWEPQGNRT